MREPHTRCRVEHLIEDMDRCGVDKAILHSYSGETIATNGQFPDPTANYYGDNPLRYFYESWGDHKDRFYWFVVPDPRKPGCIDVLTYLHSLGMQGIGETQPGYQYLMPNSPEFMKVYRFAADKGLPVVLTVEGWDQFKDYFPSNDFDEYLDMVESIIREFKDVRFMISHGGNCGTVISKDWEEYLEGNLRCYQMAAELDNLWICSCMPWWFSNNEANPLLEQQLKFLKDHVGFSKVSWGSDWPYNGSSRNFSFKSDYKTVVDYYRNLSFCGEDDLEYILGKSACEFITGQKL